MCGRQLYFVLLTGALSGCAAMNPSQRHVSSTPPPGTVIGTFVLASGDNYCGTPGKTKITVAKTDDAYLISGDNQNLSFHPSSTIVAPVHLGLTHSESNTFKADDPCWVDRSKPQTPPHQLCPAFGCGDGPASCGKYEVVSMITDEGLYERANGSLEFHSVWGQNCIPHDGFGGCGGIGQNNYVYSVTNAGLNILIWSIGSQNRIRCDFNRL